MRLIGYTRVSTDEQAREGYSLDAQREVLTAEAERNGDELVRIESDAGFSGKDLRRPGITRALRAIAEGEADGLVCTKLDRLTRSVIDTQELAEWFDRNALTLKVLDVHMDTSTASGKMMLTMMGAMAQMFRETIADNTRAAFRSPTSIPAANLARSRPRVPDDVAALIHELDGEGLGLSAIAHRLNAEQIPTARGGVKWHPSTVRSVLYERRPSKRKGFEYPTVKRRRPRRRKAAA